MGSGRGANHGSATNSKGVYCVWYGRYNGRYVMFVELLAHRVRCHCVRSGHAKEAGYGPQHG